MKVVDSDALYPVRARPGRWWVAGEKVFWIDGAQLLSANKDGSTMVPEPALSALPTYFGSAELDATRLILFAPTREGTAHALADGAATDLSLPFAAYATHVEDDVLWIASQGCADVARVSLVDGTQTSWARGNADAGVSNGEVALAVRRGAAFCSFEDVVWRTSGQSLIEHVRLAEADGAPTTIRALVSGTDVLFAFTQDQVGTRQIYRVQTSGAEAADLGVSSAVYDALLNGALFDEASGHFFGFLGDELVRFAPGDADALRMPGGQRIEGIAVDDTHIYWLGSGLLYRHEKF